MSKFVFRSKSPQRLLLVAAACLLGVAAQAQTTGNTQTCATTRVASTYIGTTMGAVATTSFASPLNLTPCTSYTGWGTGEISTAVDSKGTIYMAPVYTSAGPGVLRSHDNGQTWSNVTPLLANGQPHVRIQPYMHIDPATDRIFFHTGRSSISKLAFVTGFDISYSDDGGVTWASSSVENGGVDWGKLIPGPATTGARSYGYPNNLYFSGPTPISTPAIIINPKSQLVYNSADGGQSWNAGGSFSIVPTDYGCASSEYVLWGDGVVGPDGTVYIGGRRCATFGVSISKDNGASWNVITVPGSKLITYSFVIDVPIDPNYIQPTPLAVDKAGNLYAVWPDNNNLIRYSFSRDHGTTWSAPVVISDPSVHAVVYPAITVKSPGNIAIAYYGTTGTSGTQWNGYMAESTNALSGIPVFKGQLINDPSQPLYAQHFEVGYLWMFIGGDLNEIVQIRYAPNGDLVTAFTEDMCPGNTCVSGWNQAAQANSKWQAVLGRLVHH